MYSQKLPLLRRIRNKIVHLYRHKILGHSLSTYAQEGEDIILSLLFKPKAVGFYVDVGAYRPQVYSNTYKFYRRGWRGINIDATPGSMSAFHQTRPRDINLEIAIASEPAELTFYMFPEPALNTFDSELAKKRQEASQLQGQMTIRSRRLDDVLYEYLPKDQSIDFLSVDAEGLDLDVLRSNNWQLYRPAIVLAESLGREGGICGTPIEDYLAQQGYELIAHTLRTGFFQEKSVGEHRN